MLDMEPFRLSNSARALLAGYPTLDQILAVVNGESHEELYGLCRQWITEGVPFVFSDCPMVYESARGWLARRIGIHPKEITVIGSARVGYSLNPTQLGKIFCKNSDLDLVAVNPELFDALCKEVEIFVAHLESGELVPASPGQARWWPTTAKDLDRIMRTRGFVDSWKIPSLDRFPVARKITDSCWRLTEKLKATDESYEMKKSSLRVYRDVHSLIRQNWINLKAVVERD
jgi:hypothetical protein